MLDGFFETETETVLHVRRENNSANEQKENKSGNELTYDHRLNILDSIGIVENTTWKVYYENEEDSQHMLGECLRSTRLKYVKTQFL